MHAIFNWGKCRSASSFFMGNTTDIDNNLYVQRSCGNKAIVIIFCFGKELFKYTSCISGHMITSQWVTTTSMVYV